MYRLVRIPFNRRIDTEKNKMKPDERELEEIDPVFNIPREKIVRLRTGPPLILENFLVSDVIKMREEGKDK